MSAPFSGGSELVLGTFRSIRVFQARHMHLAPTTYHNVIRYEQANEWYTFNCNRWKWNDEAIQEKFLEHKRWLPTTPFKIVEKYGSYQDGKRTLRVCYEMPVMRNLPGNPSWIRQESLIPWDDSFTTIDNCDKPKHFCSCGFYSFYSLDNLLAGQSYWDFSSGIDEYVFGIVESSGTVLHGTKGIRSERMRILAIATPSPFFLKEQNKYLPRLFPYFQYLNLMLARYPLDKPPS